MVARMIIQAIFSSTDSPCQRLVPGAGRISGPNEVKNPVMIRIQSRQK